MSQFHSDIQNSWGEPGSDPTPVEERKEAAPPKQKQPKAPGKAKGTPANAGPKLADELDWFNQCDLRVSKIIECETIPESDYLYKEQIDVGEGQLRTIGTGARRELPLEEMKKDAFICVFANLKPRKLGPFMSNGMVMCASPPGDLEIVRPPPGSKLGERVMLEGNPIGDAFTQDR